VNPVQSSAIDLVEAVYDLDVHDDHWVPSLLEVGLPLFDQGYGVVGTTYVRPNEGGMPFPTESHQSCRDGELWQMIGAHLVSGFRLQQRILEARDSRRESSGLLFLIWRTPGWISGSPGMNSGLRAPRRLYKLPSWMAKHGCACCRWS